MKYKFYIDSKSYRVKDTGSYLRVNGWYLDHSGQSAQFTALVDGQTVPMRLKRIARPDVIQRYPRWKPAADCGFSVKVPLDSPNPPPAF